MNIKYQFIKHIKNKHCAKVCFSKFIFWSLRYNNNSESKNKCH